jgi:hypothetical protein
MLSKTKKRNPDSLVNTVSTGPFKILQSMIDHFLLHVQFVFTIVRGKSEGQKSNVTKDKVTELCALRPLSHKYYTISFGLCLEL